SGDLARTTTSFGKLTMMSGWPICHVSLSSNLRAGGMSAGFPLGAPLSTHLAMTAISSSDKEMSLLKRWTPTFLSMCHGGISRMRIFSLIDFAQGLAWSYVIRDIGANVPG